jgi:hypothetical protein
MTENAAAFPTFPPHEYGYAHSKKGILIDRGTKKYLTPIGFHNLVNMTRAMQKMDRDGYTVSDELAAALSPYPTEHINRFGNYNPNFGGAPEPAVLEFRKPPQKETTKVVAMPGSQLD